MIKGRYQIVYGSIFFISLYIDTFYLRRLLSDKMYGNTNKLKLFNRGSITIYFSLIMVIGRMSWGEKSMS